MANVEDWIGRVNLPDVYPRRDDPFRPSVGAIPQDAPAASMISSEEMIAVNVWDQWLTTPGTRPIVYQRALNFQITANVQPIPLTNGSFQCETIILDVLSTLGASVFFGYGNGVTVNSGIEVRPGLPIVLSTENTREQWEIQRSLEAIAGMIAGERQYNALGPFRAPRVVFSAADYFVVAAGAVACRVMLFPTPEYQ